MAVARGRARWALGTAGAVAALVAVVALIGGFGAVPERALPRYAVGDTYEGDRYAITLVSPATVVDRDPVRGYGLDAPELAATAVLSLRDTAGTYGESRWLRPLMTGGDGAVGTVRSARDGSVGPPVQPGLPVRVVYTWSLPVGSSLAVGDRVPLGVEEAVAATDVPLTGVTSTVLVAAFGTGG